MPASRFAKVLQPASYKLSSMLCDEGGQVPLIKGWRVVVSGVAVRNLLDLRQGHRQSGPTAFKVENKRVERNRNLRPRDVACAVNRYASRAAAIYHLHLSLCCILFHRK